MIDFRNFILGEAGIEAQSIDEALSLIEVCVDNDIDCTFVTPADYEDEPYWYVKDGSLETTRYYSDMADNVCSTWVYSEFLEEHETQ